MAKSRKVGDLYVEISGTDNKLDATLNRAEQKVSASSDKMGASVDRGLGGGFDKAGKKIEESTAGVRKLSGAIGSTVGIATQLIGAVTAISGIVIGIGQAINYILDQESRVARELYAQEESRRRSVQLINEAIVASSSVRFGPESTAGVEDRINAIKREFNELRKQAEGLDFEDKFVALQEIRIEEERRVASFLAELIDPVKAEIERLRAEGDQLSAEMVAAQDRFSRDTQTVRELRDLGFESEADRKLQQATELYNASRQAIENRRAEIARIEAEQAERERQREEEFQNRLAREREEQIKRDAELIEKAYANAARQFENSFRALLNQFNQGSANSAKRIEKAVERLASRQSFQTYSL